MNTAPPMQEDGAPTEVLPPIAPPEKRKYKPRQPKAAPQPQPPARAGSLDLGESIESVRTLADVAAEIWSEDTGQPSEDFASLPRLEQEEWCQRARESR